MIASSCCFCAIIFLTNSCAISGCAFRYNFTNCVVVSSSIARLTGNESTAPPGTTCIPNCIAWPWRGGSGTGTLFSSAIIAILSYSKYDEQHRKQRQYCHDAIGHSANDCMREGCADGKVARTHQDEQDQHECRLNECSHYSSSSLSSIARMTTPVNGETSAFM